MAISAATVTISQAGPLPGSCIVTGWYICSVALSHCTDAGSEEASAEAANESTATPTDEGLETRVWYCSAAENRSWCDGKCIPREGTQDASCYVKCSSNSPVRPDTLSCIPSPALSVNKGCKTQGCIGEHCACAVGDVWCGKPDPSKDPLAGPPVCLSKSDADKAQCSVRCERRVGDLLCTAPDAEDEVIPFDPNESCFAGVGGVYQLDMPRRVCYPYWCPRRRM